MIQTPVTTLIDFIHANWDRNFDDLIPELSKFVEKEREELETAYYNGVQSERFNSGVVLPRDYYLNTYNKK